MANRRRHLYILRLAGRFCTGIAFAGFVALLAASAASARADTEAQFETLSWRFVGPDRGGRVVAAAGHPSETFTFLAGHTGGGIWKTKDGGNTWRNVSDGQVTKGSIGDIAYAPSDPEIVYVGTGEHALRGDVSHGDGIYKSIDGGEHWANVGLLDSRQIARIVVHPENPDLVYVAALGHFSGPNEERGIFRSQDGGETWQRVLFKDVDTGAIGLDMDPENPDVLYAALWQVRRYPWGIRSAGKGSGIYRSQDGGDTWKELFKNEGLPQGVKERIGIAASPAQAGLVWALVSAMDGKGLYRSEDYGDHWVKITDQQNLFSRPFYYDHLYADTVDPNTVYVQNEDFLKSTDGGKSWDSIPSHHGDYHDLWQDSNDNQRLIVGSDGGAQVSFNGGKTFSQILNQPTAQIYTLTVDNQVPYRLYGSQQDNSSLAVSSRYRRVRLSSHNEYDIGFSEGGWIAVRPDNPNILYIGDHHWMSKYDKRTGMRYYIGPRDENNYGWGTADIKHRLFWNFPVVLSPHNPDVLYIASQYVMKTTNEGDTWKKISPDLSRADPKTLEKTPFRNRDVSSNGPYWGPITRDSNGDHWYSLIYCLAESPLKEGLIWTGSDDGLVHVTRDGGKSWENVTPTGLPEFTIVSRVDPSPHDPATAYIAATGYKLDDYTPYLFKTSDYGANWTLITKGIEDKEITRVIREDPDRKGLIFAGTETGVYVSFDDGAQWQRLQLNLPHVPVWDMRITHNDIQIATHGRGFWIFDDLHILEQQDDKVSNAKVHLFKPTSTTRFKTFSARHPRNPPSGVVIHYLLNQPAKKSIELLFTDERRNLVKRFSASIDDSGDVVLPETKAESGMRGTSRSRRRSDALTNNKGLNRIVWNFRYPNAKKVPNAVTQASQEVGPHAPPGTYQVELVVDGIAQHTDFVLLKDPRVEATNQDLEEQFDFLSDMRDKIEEVNVTILAVRKLRAALEATDSTGGDLAARAEHIAAELWAVEDDLIQHKATFTRFLHANPVMLNEKLYHLAGFVANADARPTQAQRDLFAEFSALADRLTERFHTLVRQDVPAYNRSAGDKLLPTDLGPAD